MNNPSEFLSRLYRKSGTTFHKSFYFKTFHEFLNLKDQIFDDFLCLSFFYKIIDESISVLNTKRPVNNTIELNKM